jgi:tRNA G18 (ribose-2'-O)-methylase SpoU
MRGYFSIGVEGIHKPHNLGNLMRSAYGFGANSFFTISPALSIKQVKQSDTSGAFDHLPLYEYERAEDFHLPKECQLVGVEFIDEAIELPSFRHPLRAAYVLGPEKGELSRPLLERCDFVVRIPTQFCINVGVAGAILMYDRQVSLGKFAERPVKAGGPTEALKPHIHGKHFLKRKIF